MSLYTDEQKADLAKRIEARAMKVPKRLARRAALKALAAEIRDGSFFEVQHDDDWGCDYCRNDGALSDSGECPMCGAEYPDEVQHD